MITKLKLVITCITLNTLCLAQTNIDIITPLKLPNELRIDSLKFSRTQNARIDNRIVSRKLYYLFYGYKGYNGVLAFRIVEDIDYEVDQKEYLTIKCLEKVDTIAFNIPTFKSEIRSRNTGVKKIRFLKSINGDTLKNVKGAKYLKGLRSDDHGVYNDVLLKTKNVPFRISLNVYQFKKPIIEEFYFEKSMSSLEDFLKFYETEGSNFFVFYKFECRNTSDNTKVDFRRILINPSTSEVVSDIYASTIDKVFWNRIKTY